MNFLNGISQSQHGEETRTGLDAVDTKTNILTINA